MKVLPLLLVEAHPALHLANSYTFVEPQRARVHRHRLSLRGRLLARLSSVPGFRSPRWTQSVLWRMPNLQCADCYVLPLLQERRSVSWDGDAALASGTGLVVGSPHSQRPHSLVLLHL